MRRDRPHGEVGRGTAIVRIGLVGSVNRCLQNARQIETRVPVELVEVVVACRKRQWVPGGCARQNVCDQLVTSPFLVLLTTTVQVACVDDRDGSCPFFVLAKTLLQQLVVPQSNCFKAAAPG